MLVRACCGWFEDCWEECVTLLEHLDRGFTVLNACGPFSVARFIGDFCHHLGLFNHVRLDERATSVIAWFCAFDTLTLIDFTGVFVHRNILDVEVRLAYTGRQLLSDRSSCRFIEGLGRLATVYSSRGEMIPCQRRFNRLVAGHSFLLVGAAATAGDIFPQPNRLAVYWMLRAIWVQVGIVSAFLSHASIQVSWSHCLHALNDFLLKMLTERLLFL